MANRTITVLNPLGYQENLQSADNLVIASTLQASSTGTFVGDLTINAVNKISAAGDSYYSNGNLIVGATTIGTHDSSVISNNGSMTVNRSNGADVCFLAQQQGVDKVTIKADGSVNAVSFTGEGSALSGLPTTLQQATDNGSATTNTITAAGFVGDGSSLTGLSAWSLQEVTDNGNSTTNDITINGNTTLAADGSGSFSGSLTADTIDGDIDCGTY